MRRAQFVVIAMLCVTACGGRSSAVDPSPAGVAIASAQADASPAGTPWSPPTNPPATPIPGCLPDCWFGRLTQPGPLSGEYTTSYFFGGQLTVTVPPGWYGYEDSTGELAIGLPNDESARLEFWIDVYAAKDASGTPDQSVERTSDAVIAWFLDKPIIEVVERSTTTLDGLPAESIEYRRNEKAKNEVPDCPTEIRPCVAEFGYPEWDGAFAEGDPFHSRLIVADATWGGEPHSIYVMFWATGPAYEELVDEVDDVISSVRLPEGVGP